MVKAAMPPKTYWILMGRIPRPGEAARYASLGFVTNQHQVNVSQIAESPHPQKSEPDSGN